MVTEADGQHDIGQNGNTTQHPDQQQDQHQYPDDDAPTGQRHMTELKDKVTHQKQKIQDKKNPPGGFDDTPLPDARPGYTVKFTFHKASNLPSADLHTQSSDPFLHATLTADVPRRHKEDPPVTFRTRTVHKTTNPEWEQDWVVANVPKTGFNLKCRIYDEDYPDHNDRLGNVTINIPHVDEHWEGFGPAGKVFEVKKRSGSKRAYLVKAATSALSKHRSMTPTLHVGIEVLGVSDPPHAVMCTIAPCYWFKHYSPMIGRLTGTKVNKDEESDAQGHQHGDDDKRAKKYE
jgi:stringent starvation protein B